MHTYGFHLKKLSRPRREPVVIPGLWATYQLSAIPKTSMEKPGKFLGHAGVVKRLVSRTRPRGKNGRHG